MGSDFAASFVGVHADQGAHCRPLGTPPAFLCVPFAGEFCIRWNWQRCLATRGKHAWRACFKPVWSTRDDHFITMQPSIDQALQNRPPMDFGFGQPDTDGQDTATDGQDTALAVLQDADRDRDGTTTHATTVSDLFIASRFLVPLSWWTSRRYNVAEGSTARLECLYPFLFLDRRVRSENQYEGILGGGSRLCGRFPNVRHNSTGRQGRRPRNRCRSTCAGPLPLVAEILSKKQNFTHL